MISKTERAVALNPPSPREKGEKNSIGTEKNSIGWSERWSCARQNSIGWSEIPLRFTPKPVPRDLFWFVQARPRPYFFGAGIVGAYFLLAQQNFGTEFSTLEKIWSRSIFDIQTRPRAPCCGTGFGVKCNRRVPGGTRVAFCLSKLRGLRVP